MLFQKKDITNEINSLDNALKILKDNYEKKLITHEIFIKQAQEIAKRREKYSKKINKNK